MADDKDQKQDIFTPGYKPTAPVQTADQGGSIFQPKAQVVKPATFGEVALGERPATDMPLTDPRGGIADIMAPTKRGVANVLGGITQAGEGVYNLFRHPVDTAKGIASLPSQVAQVPQAIRDINSSQDPSGRYAEVAENTAGQGAGQAIVAAAAPSIIKGTGKLVGMASRIPETALGKVTDIVADKVADRMAAKQAAAAPKPVVGEAAAPQPVVGEQPTAPKVTPKIVGGELEKGLGVTDKTPSTHPERAAFEQSGLSRADAATAEGATRQLTNAQFGEWAAKNGFDMADKSIGRGAADLKAGTHIPRSTVIEGLLKQGMKPADISESIKAYLKK